MLIFNVLFMLRHVVLNGNRAGEYVRELTKLIQEGPEMVIITRLRIRTFSLDLGSSSLADFIDRMKNLWSIHIFYFK